MEDCCKWESNLRKKYRAETNFHFSTSCGKNGLRENDYKYCPYCGKAISKIYVNKFEEVDSFGDLIPIEDFATYVKGGAFICFDGHGYLATLEKKSNIRVDMDPDSINIDDIHVEEPWATHVAWYNK